MDSQVIRLGPAQREEYRFGGHRSTSVIAKILTLRDEATQTPTAFSQSHEAVTYIKLNQHDVSGIL